MRFLPFGAVILAAPTLALASDRTSDALAGLIGGFVVLLFPLVGLALIFAGFTAWLAGTKGRGTGSWFFLGLFFGPIALAAVGLSERAAAMGSDAPRTAPRNIEQQRSGAARNG
jgi:hypothetical protein